jgi:hypothetical protein
MPAMWKTDLRLKAEAYAKRRELELLDQPLGDGTEGNVWQVWSNRIEMVWALKMHRHNAAYQRERDVYLRLSEKEVVDILGLNVPQLIHADDDALAIAMTIVVRPFALDFAAAFLDLPPDFPDEVWAEREGHWRDHFGADWPKVCAVRRAFEDLGVYLTDLHRNNIALR